MTTQITSRIHASTTNILRSALLSSLALAAPLFAAGQMVHQHAAAATAATAAPAKLVLLVREATRQFADVNVARHAGYLPAFGCVTGPDHGAMGIHYVNGAVVGSGVIDVAHPQALIYEPTGDQRRLVGVEYIVIADTWLAAHNNTPPALLFQDFQFVASPNRFNLPSFFELHVWAWQDNPNGAFTDWNDSVTCEQR